MEIAESNKWRDVWIERDKGSDKAYKKRFHIGSQGTRESRAGQLHSAKAVDQF